MATIKMEAPAGLATLHVKVEMDALKAYRLKTLRLSYIKEGILSEAKGFGNLKPDIVFRGSFFAMLSSRQIGIDICRENASKLIDAGTSVLEAVNKQIQVRRPVLSHINTADLCENYGPAKSKGADMQNITAPDGQIDRSPCGTEYAVLKIHPDR